MRLLDHALAGGKRQRGHDVVIIVTAEVVMAVDEEMMNEIEGSQESMFILMRHCLLLTQ